MKRAAGLDDSSSENACVLPFFYCFWEPSRQHEARKWCIFPLPQWAECIDFSLALVLPLFQSCTLSPKISQYKSIITLQICNIYWGQVCGKCKSEACNDIINTPLLPLKWQNHKQSSLLLCILVLLTLVRKNFKKFFNFWWTFHHFQKILEY